MSSWNTSEPALTLPGYWWPFPKLNSSLPGLGNEHSRASLQPTLHLEPRHKESKPEDERLRTRGLSQLDRRQQRGQLEVAPTTAVRGIGGVWSSRVNEPTCSLVLTLATG